MPDSVNKIDRILVALDTTLHNLDTLKLAADLAVRRRAELSTLFVEDENLIRLAGLPFAREVERTSALQRQIDSRQVACTIKAQAGQARRTLAQVCAEMQLRSTMRVVRGYYVVEALSAAGEFDVLFIGGRTSVTHRGLGKVHPPTVQAPVWTIYDGSTAASRALIMATDLTRPEDRNLVIFLPLTTSAGPNALRRQAAELLDNFRFDVRYVVIPTGDTEDILNALGEERCRLLVLSRDDAMHPDKAIKTLLEEIDCPVVLVP